LQPLKSNEQRTRIDPENALAHLFDAERNPVSVHGFQSYRPEDEHVQRALDEITRLVCHKPTPPDDQKGRLALLLLIVKMRRAKPTEVKFDPTQVLACFLTFAHRFFAAFAIAALRAADRTHFLTLRKGDFRKAWLTAKAKTI
jgi:hypothetical protein